MEGGRVRPPLLQAPPPRQHPATTAAVSLWLVVVMMYDLSQLLLLSPPLCRGVLVGFGPPDVDHATACTHSLGPLLPQARASEQ